MWDHCLRFAAIRRILTTARGAADCTSGAASAEEQTRAAIEAGRYSPSLECAMNIAETLNAPLEEIFYWSESSKG